MSQKGNLRVPQVREVIEHCCHRTLEIKIDVGEILAIRSPTDHYERELRLGEILDAPIADTDLHENYAVNETVTEEGLKIVFGNRPRHQIEEEAVFFGDCTCSENEIEKNIVRLSRDDGVDKGDGIGVAARESLSMGMGNISLFPNDA